MKVDKKEFLGIIRAKGLWTSAGITKSLIIPDRPKIRTEVKCPFFSTFYFTIPESQEIKKVTVSPLKLLDVRHPNPHLNEHMANHKVIFRNFKTSRLCNYPLLPRSKRSTAKTKSLLNVSRRTSRMRMIEGQTDIQSIRNWYPCSIIRTRIRLLRVSSSCLNFHQRRFWIIGLLWCKDERKCCRIFWIELHDGLICWRMKSFVSLLISTSRLRRISMSFSLCLRMMKIRKKQKRLSCHKWLIRIKLRKRSARIWREWRKLKRHDIEYLKSFRFIISKKIQESHKSFA